MMPRKCTSRWIAALIVGACCLPLRAHADRMPGVIMVIGGMANDSDTTPLQAPSTHIASEPDDVGRLSVIIQPASRSSPTGPNPQTAASIASRVMALSPVIDEAAQSAGVDRALLMAVIDVESGGNPRAVSPKGASGLMQLMPGTGRRHGASDLFDPRQNIGAGARYLKALMRQFGELPLVLAAYNAGEGAVQMYGGQMPPYAETMSYVPRVIARYAWYRTMTAADASIQAAKGSAGGRVLLIGSGSRD